MTHRILVVDDDDSIRRLVSAVLRRNGYEIDEASDGQEAIDKIDTGAYDGIFLDLTMPVRDGYAVLAHVRERGLSGSCVVIMTAAVTRGTQGLDFPFVQNVLYKPFELEDVLTSAAACISGRK